MKTRENLGQTLRNRGYRVTPQRMMILAAIDSSTRPNSAEDIHSQVHAKYPYIDISTVYRTLQLLKELDLVSETDLGGGRFLYHPVGRAHHHHLRCIKCAKIQDIDGDVLENLEGDIRRRYGFDPNMKYMAISGTCVVCRSFFSGTSAIHCNCR